MRPERRARVTSSGSDAPRLARERGPAEPPALRSPPRAPRAAEARFSEDGISYQVREVGADELAELRSTSGSPVAAPSEAQRSSSEPSFEPNSSGGWEGPVEEAFVNVGRDDGIRTTDLHQALTSAGVSHSDTAYVRIRQRHTFIGVRQGLLDQVIAGLTGQKLAQRSVEAQPARPRQAPRR